MCKRKRNSPESHLNFVRGLLRLRANERALSNSGGFRLLFAKPKTYPLVYERFDAGDRIIVAVNPRAAGRSVVTVNLAEVEMMLPQALLTTQR